MEINKSQLSNEVKGKYAVHYNTFVHRVSSATECDLEVEIGDIKQPDFLPQVKFKRFGNEFNYSVRLVHNETPTLKTEGDKIKWQGDKVEAHFSDKPSISDEGGHAFDVVVKDYDRTKDYVAQFTLQGKGLEFVKQRSYKEEHTVGQHTDAGIVATITDTDVYDADGRVMFHRPENVLGGYAVFMPKTGYVKGGRNYKAGDFGFIYRPYATDEKGNRTWCELDITDGIMSVTVPQKFLATAVGYVTIDPDFGYTTAGSSTANISSCVALVSAALTYTASEGDTITNFSWYGESSGDSGFDMAAYSMSALNVPQNRLAIGINIRVAAPNTDAWNTSVAVEQAMTAGTKYAPAIGNDGANTEGLHYNTGTGVNRSSDTTTGALPATWTESDTSSTRYSIYATYEEATGGITDLNGLGILFVATKNDLAVASIGDYNGLAA